MKSSDRLTKELISYIFNNLGLVFGPLFGKAGISESIFKSHKKIKVTDEKNKIEYIPVYSAFCEVDSSKIHVLAAVFEDEFVVALRLDDFSVYGMKQASSEDDIGICILHNGSSWIGTTMRERLMLCAGVETLTDHGVAWKPELEIEDLYKFLLELVEM
jgi:hypothetical protein